jgi:hypothetical protein
MPAQSKVGTFGGQDTTCRDNLGPMREPASANGQQEFWGLTSFLHSD